MSAVNVVELSKPMKHIYDQNQVHRTKPHEMFQHTVPKPVTAPTNVLSF